jgi:hypothetical protein
MTIPVGKEYTPTLTGDPRRAVAVASGVSMPETLFTTNACEPETATASGEYPTPTVRADRLERSITRV